MFMQWYYSAESDTKLQEAVLYGFRKSYTPGGCATRRRAVKARAIRPAGLVCPHAVLDGWGLSSVSIVDARRPGAAMTVLRSARRWSAVNYYVRRLIR